MTETRNRKLLKACQKTGLVPIKQQCSVAAKRGLVLVNLWSGGSICCGSWGDPPGAVAEITRPIKKTPACQRGWTTKTKLTPRKLNMECCKSHL